MPKGRMVNRKISDDYRLGKCPVEARWLYAQMITWLDREGRLQADPRWVNKKFFAFDNYSDEQVEEWLEALAEQKKAGMGLIELYEVEERKYLWMPGFEGEQGEGWLKSIKQREAESYIPAPPTTRKKGKKPAKPPAPGVKPEDIIDPNLAAAVKYYENKIGQLSPMMFERLKSALDDFGLDQFKAAIDEAAKNTVYNLRYIEKILENWKDGKDRRHSGANEQEENLGKSIGEPLG